MDQSSCTGEHVEIKWSGMTGTRTQGPLILGQTYVGFFDPGPNEDEASYIIS
jgi:hypothetical protein